MLIYFKNFENSIILGIAYKNNAIKLRIMFFVQWHFCKA